MGERSKVITRKYQAVKRLELMERRLAIKPDQTTAYDNQMKEMEILRFARKFSEEEMKNYKGPVHCSHGLRKHRKAYMTAYQKENFSHSVHLKMTQK